MRNRGVQAERRSNLKLPHMLPLAKFARDLRDLNFGEVPDFDPRDGGAEARFLFLFEKPGPMTATAGRKRRPGSGFISRDNDDPTAEAVFHFMRAAAVPREASLIWNVIPWWNGTRKVTSLELQRGTAAAINLVRLVPHLRAIVLVGGRALAARPMLASLGLPTITSSHPSPLVRARWPERWSAIPSEWAQVHQFASAVAEERP